MTMAHSNILVLIIFNINIFFPFLPPTHNFDLSHWNYCYYPSDINYPDLVSCLFVCICFACFSSSCLFILTRTYFVIGVWAVKSARK
jgi:hypothetical protein